MRILIIDGQGGGVGRSLAEAVLKRNADADIVVVGTNATATGNMMKAGRVDAATGENAVCYNAQKADIIVGPIGIIMSNAMLGEITPKMANAISSSDAKIILVPMNRCHATVVGIQEKKVAEYIEEAVDEIVKYMQ